MVRRLRSWWLKVKKHPFLATVITAAFVAVVVFIFAVNTFGWDWTGFNGGYGQVTTHTPGRDTVSPPAKTLWDWLQLLIIPFVLAVGGYLFNLAVTRNERKAADKHSQTEREIVLDNQREAALQAYIDKLAELLLKEGLREAEIDTEVLSIARARTLTILRRLDGIRKGSLLNFLYESKLIYKDKVIIDLHNANLNEANLFGVNLQIANLKGVYLMDAQLMHTNLSGADLTNARLTSATIGGANLSGANLSGVWMPFSKLYEVNLSESILCGANLRETDLLTVNLFRADLSGANFSGANFSGASLIETILKDATGITVEELEEQAESLQGATMPDGSIHP